MLEGKFAHTIWRPEGGAQHSEHSFLQERCARGTIVTSIKWVFFKTSVEILSVHYYFVAVYATFQEYVGGLLRPQAPDALGSGE